MMKSLKQMISTLIDLVQELILLLKSYSPPSAEQEEVYLRSYEVAELLNMNIRTVQRYARRKVLRTMRVGEAVLYLKSDISSFLSKN